MRDTKITLRLWRHNPGSTLAAYLTLSVSIAATTAIFSILNGLLISPLPVADASHVARVTSLDRNSLPAAISLPDALDIKHRLASTSQFAFYRDTNGNLSGGDGAGSRPQVAHMLEVDADLFQVMGIQMMQGRPFTAAANQPGHACEVVISWSLWQARFNGQSVVGQTIRLNEQPCRVDGVLPRYMDLPLDTDLWIAKAFDLGNPLNGRGLRAFYALAHWDSATSVSSFNAELNNIAVQLSRENPNTASGLRLQATPLREWLTKDVKSSVYILFCAVTAVLLMACVNVANLLLARASTRMREMSVRAAIGATRASLFRQLLTESMLLAGVSSLSGVLLSLLLVHWIKGRPNLNIPRLEAITVDWRVLLFALLTALLTGLIFGSLPALKVSFASITGVLREAGGRTGETRRQQLARKILVGAETALATVLLLGSLLLLRSFSEVSKINLGFQSDHLLTAYISLNPDDFNTIADYRAFTHKILENLRAKPGIQLATLTTSIPLQVTSGSGPVQIEGQPIPIRPADSPAVVNTGISPAFRRTLNIPLKAGVDFEEDDDREDDLKLLVNATFARTFFPGQKALGKRFRYSPHVNPKAPWQQIIGVLADTRQAGPEAVVRPELYQPLSRIFTRILGVVIRTSDNPANHLRDLEDAVRIANPDFPIFYPRTMEQVEARRLGSRIFITTLLAGFALVALLLASAGIFAVIAYSVSQRTSELGIRIACGATQSDILGMIVIQGLLPALIGIAIGLIAAFLLSRFLANLLYGVLPTDAASYSGAVLILALCSALAALLPAYRAMRTEPWQALRYQ